MKEYKNVKSTVEPIGIVIDEVNVWVYSNIKELEEINGEEVFKGYEYDLIQCEKDEYIKIMVENNSTMEKRLTDMQLALVEVYEGMV